MIFYSITRRLLFFFLRFSAIPFLLREITQKRKVTILLYHDIEPQTANEHFQTIRKCYNIISLKEYLDARKTGEVDKLPHKSLVITIDDGHKGNAALRQVFIKYGIHPTIFLCSAITGTRRDFWWNHGSRQLLSIAHKIPDDERIKQLASQGFTETQEFETASSLSHNEIEALKDIVDFQSHTLFHPFLPKCTTARSHQEISQSKQELEAVYNLNIYALSYPNGDYSEREIYLAREAGYECGITSDVGYNGENTDLFKLKRINVRDGADINELLVKASGLWGYLKNSIIRPSYGYVDVNEVVS